MGTMGTAGVAGTMGMVGVASGVGTGGASGGASSTALVVPQGIPVDSDRPWTEKDFATLRKAKRYYLLGLIGKEFGVGCSRVEMNFEVFKAEKDEQRRVWVEKKINGVLVAATFGEMIIDAVPQIPFEVPGLRDGVEEFMNSNVLHFEREFDELGPAAGNDRGLSYTSLGLKLLAKIKPKKKDGTGALRLGAPGQEVEEKEKKGGVWGMIGGLIGGITGYNLTGDSEPATKTPAIGQSTYPVNGAIGVSSTSPNVDFTSDAGGGDLLLDTLTKPLPHVSLSSNPARSPATSQPAASTVTVSTHIVTPLSTPDSSAAVASAPSAAKKPRKTLSSIQPSADSSPLATMGSALSDLK